MTDATEGAGRANPWVILMVLCAWVATLPRMVPTSTDAGIFTSIADRLGAGDRLYVDLWDNKDPLFYYILATGRALTPFAQFVIEIFWFAVVAASVYVAARWSGQTRNSAVVAGFAMAPVAVAGSAYIAGYTHLPGVALSLAAFAWALRTRYVWSGVTLGLLWFVKLPMVPFGIALLSIALLTMPGRRSGVVRATLGFLATALTSTAVLALRGELGGYFQIQIGNVVYSQGPGIESGWRAVVDHFRQVVGPNETVTLVSTVAILATGALWWSGRTSDRPTRLAAVWWATTISLTLAALSIATIGLWPHHAEVLAVSTALAAVLVTAGVAMSRARISLPAVFVVGATALLLAGALGAADYARSLRTMPHNVAALASQSPEAAALLSIGEPGSYARVGMGEDPPGHAAGLDRWDLECRRFHQYWFQSREAFDEVLDCLPSADYVLMMDIPEAFAQTQEFPEWRRFRTEVGDILSSRFDCIEQDWGHLCTARAS